MRLSFFKWSGHHRELKKIKQDGYLLNELQTMMFEKIYKTPSMDLNYKPQKVCISAAYC